MNLKTVLLALVLAFPCIAHADQQDCNPHTSLCNILKLGPMITITTERVEAAPPTSPDITIIWYRVTNNAGIDLSSIVFACNVFKKDGSFLSTATATVQNVRNGQSEYEDEYIRGLPLSEFGRAECRAVILSG
jgi:hypothetical protein